MLIKAEFHEKYFVMLYTNIFLSFFLEDIVNDIDIVCVYIIFPEQKIKKDAFVYNWPQDTRKYLNGGKLIRSYRMHRCECIVVMRV